MPSSAKRETEMELLAPTGGMEQLRYALHFGSDAMYLAGERFGLRQQAKNFPSAELASAVTLAHEHGKRVYVTANSLVHQGDLGEFHAYLELLEKIGADAAIVNDLATISLMSRYAPRVAIHVSMQASVVNAESAQPYHSMGEAGGVGAGTHPARDSHHPRGNPPPGSSSRPSSMVRCASPTRGAA